MAQYGEHCGRAMGEPLLYIASMGHSPHAPPTIQQAIERADAIEQRTHGLPLRAIQSPLDLSDAMRALLARLSARTGNVASGKVNDSPLSANDE